MKKITIIIVAFAWVFMAGCTQKDERIKPNIVFILADDLGVNVPGSYGGSTYKTPNIDHLAKTGIKFTHCYSAPVCSPSRVKLLTGRYGFRTGQEWGHIPSDEITFGHLLEKAGYKTALAGKWQLALLKNEPDHIKKMGFEESCVFGWHEGPRYYDPLIYQNGKILQNTKGQYGPDIYTRFLIDFIKRNKDKRFLAYYPMALPHEVSNDLKTPPPPGPTGHYQTYKEAVEKLDRIVGKILYVLDSLHLRENTLILFTGDNGTPYHYITKYLNGKYVRIPVYSYVGDSLVPGGKSFMTDAGTHVPLIANWQGVTPPGTMNADLIDFSDFLPTFADMAEVPLPADRMIDGYSFAPQLYGKKGNPRKWVYQQWEDTAWIRNTVWKLYTDGRLFNMKKDPLEKNPILQKKENAASAEVRKYFLEVLKTLKERFFPGLIGAYYGDPDLTNIKFSEELTSLNNSWTEQTGHGTSWSGQYVGYLLAPITGKLTILAETNKELHLTLADKQAIISENNPEDKVNLIVKQGEKVPINIKYYHRDGNAGGFNVFWKWSGHAKSIIPDTDFVYSETQAKHWHYFTGPDPATIDYTKFPRPKERKNVVVFYEKNKFAGWPTNGGMWHWGDEMLVNFTVGAYKEMQHHHSIDETKPTQSVLARSLDGGDHWTLEGEYKIIETKNLQKIDFTNPNLAIKVYSDYFIVSTDRGKTWTGNYPIPGFGYKKLTNRTDYIPLSKEECLFFLSREDKSVQARLQDKSFAAITRDGGLSFEKLGDQSPDDAYRSVMPSSVLLSKNHILSATRRRYDEKFGDQAPRLPHDWIEVFESKDGGKTWHFLSKVAETDKGNFNGNPPSMLQLRDGRICVTYGYRSQPYGIRAKLSSDKGKTWGKEIHLRDHSGSFDFGYTRSVQRTDGKIVTIYYFTSDSLKEQHIEATIWDPNSITN